MNKLSQTKEDIISVILSNQTILKCLSCVNNNADILQEPDITDKKEIMRISREHIYRNKRAPIEQHIEQKTYICIIYGSIDYTINATNSWKEMNIPYWYRPSVQIYLYSTEELDDNIFVGSRLETIEAELLTVLNGKFREEGFGNLNFDVSEYIHNLPNGVVGRRITMTFVNEMGI